MSELEAAGVVVFAAVVLLGAVLAVAAGFAEEAGADDAAGALAGAAFSAGAGLEAAGVELAGAPESAAALDFLLRLFLVVVASEAGAAVSADAPFDAVSSAAAAFLLFEDFFFDVEALMSVLDALPAAALESSAAAFLLLEDFFFVDVAVSLLEAVLESSAAAAFFFFFFEVLVVVSVVPVSLLACGFAKTGAAITVNRKHNVAIHRVSLLLE